MTQLNENEPRDPLKMTEEDKRRIREIQARALREVSPGLESAVRIRLPGSARSIGTTDAGDTPLDARTRSRMISWTLFAVLVGLVGMAVWTMFFRP